MMLQNTFMAIKEIKYQKYVIDLNLDINKLLKQYKYLIFKKYLLKFPSKILKQLRMSERKIIYVVENKKWVQAKRFDIIKRFQKI